MNVIEKTLMLGVTFLLIFACKKLPEEPQPDKLIGDKAILVGTWHWTHTHHRFNWCDGPELNETIEPEADIYSFIMKEEGKVEFYKNTNLLNSHEVFFKHFTPLEEVGFSLAIYLDGNEDDVFVGRVYNKDSLLTYDFPYLETKEGCEQYNNYFE